MPVQSLFGPEGSVGAALVDVAGIEGMLLVGTFSLPSVIVTTLEIPKVDSEADGDNAIDKLEDNDPVVLELDDEVVNVEVVVQEVAVNLVEAKAAEALKSQSFATNNSVWLLQQLGPVSTQQNATSLFSKTPAVDVQLRVPTVDLDTGNTVGQIGAWVVVPCDDAVGEVAVLLQSTANEDR
ncbi:hypothetical protein KCV03_g53, partial [Aureobasidium melanogenum]